MKNIFHCSGFKLLALRYGYEARPLNISPLFFPLLFDLALDLTPDLTHLSSGAP